MQQSPDIERIVHEVVRRLRLATASQCEMTDGAAAEKRQEAPSDTQQLTDRVITLDLIAQIPASTRRLAVCGAAVVTPSVKDELKKNGIELIRVEAAAIGQNLAAVSDYLTQQTRQLLIANYRTPVSTRDLIRGLQDAGTRVREVTDATSPEQLASSLVTSVVSQHSAIVLTGLPHVLTCAVNRRETLRAAFVQNRLCVAAARKTLDANVLIVDPTRWSTFDLVETAQSMTVC